MEPAASSYEDAALTYIRLVSLESPAAAAILDQLRVRAGARAALRAALVLTLFSTEVKHNDWTPPFDNYSSLLHEFPEAIQGVEQAMNCCLADWALAQDATRDEAGT